MSGNQSNHSDHSDKVSYELEDDVAVITLDDGKRNAFGFEMIAGVNAALDRATSEARAIVFTGRPGALSAGFDLKVIMGDDVAATMELGKLGGRLMMRIYGQPQPVVVAATGHSIALGALFLLTADLRIGADGDFKVGLNEAAIGVPLPEFAFALVRDRLSKRHTARAVLGGTLYSPAEAVDVGYLDEIAPVDELRKTALEHATKLASYKNKSYAQIKRGIRGATIDAVAPTLE